MEFFDELGRTITDAADKVGKKTEKIVELQRVKGQISSMERNIEKNISELGYMVYEKYQLGEELDQKFIPICEEIQRRRVLLDQYREEVAEMKGLRRCDECGEPQEKDAVFCKKCGARLG